MPRGLLDAFSARSREVARTAERFRAQYGRAPERGELRQLKLENRKAKVLVTSSDLQQAWNDTAARFDFTARQPGRPSAVFMPVDEPPLEDRVEQHLTAGPFAGAALLAGTGGTLLFGALGLLTAIPFLLRVHKRCGNWRTPGLLLATFAAVFTISALLIAPAITGSGENSKPSRAPIQQVPSTQSRPGGHEGHHD